MIPKIIHYCWFGRGPLPEIAQKCIESWKKYLPEYELKLWNEDNFDVNICKYTKEAYAAHKYAFVSDYARLWILYHFGGVYFDTDVELIASPKDILERGPFMGLEVNGNETPITTARCAPGLGMASFPEMTMLKDLLSRYESYRFISPLDGSLNLKTIVEYTTEYLKEFGFPPVLTEIFKCQDFYIYPKDYFSPRSLDGRKMIITPNSISIHWFTNTWNNQTQWYRIKSLIKEFCIHHLLPTSITRNILVRNKKQRDMYFKNNFMIN